ncbi:MAG: YggS family pyridoxal phosphate-dependent enzyme [Eubacteriales bacterium]|jgi:pyridoxal phosphate enzyme (YggS family)
MQLSDEELRQNLQEVQKRIEAACRRVGRDPREVKLLAVSKTKPAHDVEVVRDAGQKMFGENYVQEIRSKYEEIGDSVEWHMIGHLQRNKVKYIIDKVKLIHSLDTIRLAQQIEKEAAKRNIVSNVLMEVNYAREETKWGFMKEEAPEAAKEIAQFPHIRLCGLMTSAPVTDDPETNRGYFRGMRELAGQIDRMHIPNVSMDILSMGMTQDYEVAVEEGATIVRVGTAIFGERNYHVDWEVKREEDV